MNKKGLSGIAIGVIIGAFILIVFLVILTIVILNQQSAKKETQNENNITIYLQAFDTYGNSIPASYKILDNSNLLQGTLSQNAYTEFGNTSSKNILILCSEGGYYSEIMNKSFEQVEINLNISKIDCHLNKIGTLQIHNVGQLQINGNSPITLNINSQGIFQNLEMCLSWTGGITKVDFGNDSIKEIDIPGRFSNTVDKCFDFNTTLSDSEINIPFTVTTNQLSVLDTLNFYIFDKDYAYDGNFTLYSEFNGVNLGSANDIVYTISNQNIQ